MFYQMANQLNQRGGNFNESVGKVNNIVSGLKELKFMDVYDYWKNNTPIEGGKYTDGEFRGILANLKSELLKGKNEAQLDGEIMALEEILKIPGIVVKVTDWWKDILEGYNADSNKGYVDVIGDTCLSVGTNNKSDPNCGDYQKYGPFRYAVGPSGNENQKTVMYLITYKTLKNLLSWIFYQRVDKMLKYLVMVSLVQVKLMLYYKVLKKINLYLFKL